MIKITGDEIRIEGATLSQDEKGVALYIDEAGRGGRRVIVKDNHIVLADEAESYSSSR